MRRSDGPRSPGSGSPLVQAAEWATILVVEDDTAIREVLSELLGRFGYHVVASSPMCTWGR